MMSGAPVRRIRLLFGEHKFNVIVSVRDLEINPGEHFAGGTATPCLLEAQYLRIEFVLGVTLVTISPTCVICVEMRESLMYLPYASTVFPPGIYCTISTL